MEIGILVLYHLLFFHRFYKNPFLLCTSEIASTFFPHWLWIGRQLRQGISPARDNIFYKYPASISFLSSFYPLNLLMAYLSSWLNKDKTFKLYTVFILSHYLLGSTLAYILFSRWCNAFVALFGAITLVYSAYMVKPQTPAFVYTANWLIGTFLGGPIGGLCFGMCLLGGYYPILVYFAPFIALIHPFEVSLGLLIALPQILPFLGYYKKSVRMIDKVDPKQGKVPPKRLLHFVFPFSDYRPVNGIHYPEMEAYMSVLPFLFIWWSGSRFWFLFALGVWIAVGILPPLARIPARALHLVTFSIAILATDGLSKIGLNQSTLVFLLILQGFLLLRNSRIYPSFPFSQWWNKPSRLYAIYRKKNEWPYFSGYLTGKRHSEYAGAFRLRN